MRRKLLLVVVVLLAVQTALWAVIGRPSFPGVVAEEIRSITTSELVVSKRSLSPLRDRDAKALVAALSETTRVWDKNEVPADYYDQISADTEFGRVYLKATRLSFGEISSSPIVGRARFGLSMSGMAGTSYEKTWLFVFGVWLETGPHRVTSRS